MISGIASPYSPYPSSPGGGAKPPAPSEHSGKELTTVTTHCDKDHRHTPACPHTVYTRSVEEAQRRGEYIDMYV